MSRDFVHTAVLTPNSLDRDLRGVGVPQFK
jgi:hypothetical protein